MKHEHDLCLALYIAICALALIAVAALSIGFSAARAETLTCAVSEGQYVNVRNRPRADAQKVGELHNGDEIDAVSVSGGWIEITYKDRAAYVSANYFEVSEPKGGTVYVVEANGRVRVRATPGGKRVDWADPGDTVRVFGWRYGSDGGKWARCAYGYIAASYLVPETVEGER